MNLLKPLATAAIVMLAAAPVIANPGNPAAKLSLNTVPLDDSGGSDRSNSRSRSGETEHAFMGAGGGTLVLLGIGVAAAIGAAVALGDSDSTPASN